MKIPQIYAFYLPQFHRTPENDEWWGEGFTEWTTVKNAKSLFPGHNQPHEPLAYYNLLNKETMEKQTALMQEYGVDGMCFYHYYFENGRKILEKPAENLLEWKDINMPFCFYWANQSWIRSWSNVTGGNKWSEIYERSEKREGDGVLLRQEYGGREQWKAHFYYLLPFFKDCRYLKKDGRPLFMLYRPEDISCLDEMMRYWNVLMKEEGMPEIYFIGKDCLLDGELCHEPQNAFTEYGSRRFENEYGISNIVGFDEVWNVILQNQRYNSQVYSCGYAGYDDSPRRGKRGTVIIGSTPEKFKHYMIRLLVKAEEKGSDFVFLNAWNEWGEGMYLEPDVEWGYAYLEALREAKKFVAQNREVLLGVAHDKESSADDGQDGRLVNKEKRYREYWKTLDKWLQLEISGKPLSGYLRKQGVETVAVYGLGMLGASLVMELERDGITIQYGIDQDIYKGREFDFPVYGMQDTLPKTDIIVVTVGYAFEAIRRQLERKGDFKIISLEKLIILQNENTDESAYL